MDKKNIIIIILIIALIALAIVVAGTLMNNVNADTPLERVNLSDTCSLELPKINFDEKNATNEAT